MRQTTKQRCTIPVGINCFSLGWQWKPEKRLIWDIFHVHFIKCSSYGSEDWRELLIGICRRQVLLCVGSLWLLVYDISFSSFTLMLASLNFVDSFPGPPFLLELRTFIQRICCLPGFFLIFLDHFLLPFSPQKDIEFDVFLMENVEENMQCSPLCPLFFIFFVSGFRSAKWCYLISSPLFYLAG